jgi:hypothetical protein
MTEKRRKKRNQGNVRSGYLKFKDLVATGFKIAFV